MNEKKAYPLRINAAVLAAMQRWSDDELRSVNAQIEYVLREALRRAGRLPGSEDGGRKAGDSAGPRPAPGRRK
ncbi:MAG: Arc family DNA binding domain-containing protein [Lysobacterales bacterium]